MCIERAELASFAASFGTVTHCAATVRRRIDASPHRLRRSMRRLLVTLVVLLHAQSGACSCEATLHKHYNGTLNCAKHRDMCHFAPVLRRLASHGSSVVEMGVRSIVSSWARSSAFSASSSASAR